jgi:small subunit ribosomal protein S7
MSRKKRDFKRIVLPDPRYGDVVVGKAINVIMDSGKKGVAERALYGALDVIAKKTGADAVETFHKALNNIKPVVHVESVAPTTRFLPKFVVSEVNHSPFVG